MKVGLWEIRHGDRVTIRNHFGVCRTGRAVGLLLFPTHATINMGGKHGTPAVADPSNIVMVNGRGHEAR